MRSSIQWNYTTVLNIVALVVAAACWATGSSGPEVPMLKMMGGGAPVDRGEGHGGGHGHGHGGGHGGGHAEG